MTPCENYLRDVVPALLERARDAKAKYAAKRSERGEDQAQFEAGQALGYYDAISHLISELRAFGIPFTAVGLSPEIDVEVASLL
jgi:ribosomal protein S12 methylthiotransferase accessory factor YcaO